MNKKNFSSANIRELFLLRNISRNYFALDASKSAI